MKLIKVSEAMREGAKLGPQLWGKMRDGNGGTCAMGAVAMYLYENYRKVQLDNSEIFNMATTCPLGAQCWVDGATDAQCLQSVIIHLNDLHHWSREAIAEWIGHEFEQPTAAEVIEKLVIDEPVPAFAETRCSSLQDPTPHIADIESEKLCVV